MTSLGFCSFRFLLAFLFLSLGFILSVSGVKKGARALYFNPTWDDDTVDTGASSSTGGPQVLDRVRGGIRQRISYEPRTQQDTDVVRDVPLNNDLRRDWGKGTIRPRGVDARRDRP